MNDGKIDGFNGNEYVNDLGAGNLAAAFAWSGDVAQITLDNPDVRFAIPDSGGMLWSDNFLIPIGTDKADLASEWINFFYDPKNAAVLTAGIQYVSPVAGTGDAADGDGGRRGEARREPARRPDAPSSSRSCTSSARSTRPKRRSSTSGSPRSSARADPRGEWPPRSHLPKRRRNRRSRARRSSNATIRGSGRGGVTPWLLLAPGIIWLLLFFFVPLYTLFRMSLSERTDRFSDPTFNWHWANYGDAFSRFGDQFYRSFAYAAAATLLALAIGYPLAYVIAFRGGRFRNVLLGLVVIPFFTNFLIRTLAWRTILGEQSWVTSVLRNVGILGASDTFLRTPIAVIGGLTYNFLPFMVLPIYVALEKIDPGLVDAARDLYSTTWRAFRKIVFPMSLPGVFAGSLLVFIPAAGDFVNAYYLGNAHTTMIGSVVQDQFLVQGDYPVAAALSFVFMGIVMVLVTIYARVLGTEDLT